MHLPIDDAHHPGGKRRRSKMSEQSSTAVAKADESPGEKLSKTLIGRIADKYGVGNVAVMTILRDSVFIPGKGEPKFTDQEIACALVLSDQYDLNPFAKEVYLTRNKWGGLLVIVGVDGWFKVCNRQPRFDGVSFTFETDGKRPVSCTCTMKIRGREPIALTEFFAECFRDTGPWKSHPHRMLRHKAFIQTARLAFGLVSIRDVSILHQVTDPDEAGRILEVKAEKQMAELPAPDPLELKETMSTAEPFLSDVAKVKGRQVELAAAHDDAVASIASLADRALPEDPSSLTPAELRDIEKERSAEK